jgi:hypothetical protein
MEVSTPEDTVPQGLQDQPFQKVRVLRLGTEKPRIELMIVHRFRPPFLFILLVEIGMVTETAGGVNVLPFSPWLLDGGPGG